METRWKTSGSTGSIGSIESMCSMAPGGDGAGLPPAAEWLRMDIRCSRAEGEGGPSESQPSRRRQYGVFAPRFCAVGPGEIQRSWSHVPQTERNFLVERHQTRPRPILPKRWQVRLCPGGSASLPASTEAESLYVLELEVFIGTVVARQLHGLEARAARAALDDRLVSFYLIPFHTHVLRELQSSSPPWISLSKTLTSTPHQ